MRHFRYFLLVLFFALPAYGQRQSGNIAYNGSFEEQDQVDSRLAQGWKNFGNGYFRQGAFGSLDGGYAVQLQRGGGAIQRIALIQAYPRPVRISVHLAGMDVEDNPADKLGVSMDCRIGYRNQEVAFCPATPKTKNVGTFGWKWDGYNTMSFTGTFEPIDWIEVRVRMGDVAGTAWFDEVRIEEYNLGDGMVTFMFDDSLKSTYTKGFPLLQEYGFPASEAVITSYVDKDDNHLTLSELHEMQDAGWSIVSHTVTHPDLPKVNDETLVGELYESQKYLIDHKLFAKHIALPYGGYNARVMARVQAQEYAGYRYLSARTVDRGFNTQGAFPYNIRIQEIDITTTVNDVKAWIADAQERGAWLVLLIHEIDNENDIYTVPRSRLVQMIYEVYLSCLSVVTYDEGFDRITLEN